MKYNGNNKNVKNNGIIKLLSQFIFFKKQICLFSFMCMGALYAWMYFTTYMQYLFMSEEVIGSHGIAVRDGSELLQG